MSQLVESSVDQLVAPSSSHLEVVVPEAAGISAEPQRQRARRAGYREVLGLREYRSIVIAELWSCIGDQVAAVAVAVLLYQRSGSALIAALGYSSAFIPWAVGGPLLAVYADRLPARQVVVGGDLLRAVLIGTAAIPGIPLLAIGLLVLAAGFVAPPFDSAASALLPQVLDDNDRYAVALSLQSMTLQATSLAGFAGGGLLVAAITPQGALAFDAVTFALSALLLRRGLQDRPAAMAGSERRSLFADATEGLKIVRADRRRYGPLLLGMVGASTLIVPEAIATAYAHSLGYGAAVVGLIMAAVASGKVVGVVVLGRLVSESTRRKLMWPMALFSTLPPLAMAIRPGVIASLLLLAAAGVGSTYQIVANASFAAAVPREARGRAFGIALTGMNVSQGVAIVAAGAAAQVLAPNTVVTGAAVLGAICVLGLRRATRWQRHLAGRPERVVLNVS